MLQERQAAATSRPHGLLGVCRLRPHTAAERSRPVSTAGPTGWQPTLPVQPLLVGTPEDGAKQGDRCPLNFNSVSGQGPELSPGLEGAPSSLPPRPPGSAPPPSALQLHAQAPPSPQLHSESIWSLDFKRWSFVSRRARRSTQPELLGRERLPVMLTLRERGSPHTPQQSSCCRLSSPPWVPPLQAVSQHTPFCVLSTCSAIHPLLQGSVLELSEHFQRLPLFHIPLIQQVFIERLLYTRHCSKC